MSRRTYAEKLRDPRWQRKRLEILERDGWACRECEAKDKTLHVHHGFYAKGYEPWEYPNESLHTLCEDCHTNYQEAISEIHQGIGIAPLSALQLILGFVNGTLANWELCESTIPVRSWEEGCGIADAFEWFQEWDVLNSVQDHMFDTDILRVLVANRSREKSGHPLLTLEELKAIGSPELLT